MKKIKIIEVGPRDGLQNEKQSISVEDKIKFIKLLTEAGFQEIECGAFVSSKWVPQMADSDKIFENLKESSSKTTYSALVPNMKGMEAALKVGVKKIAVFTAASETFNQKNINCSIEESIERFKPVVAEARKNHIAVRGYVSTAFICPYEGEIKPESVLPVVQELLDHDIKDISIGDTIGKATPKMVHDLIEELIKICPKEYIAMHFHDTYQKALDNVAESLKFDITNFDSSAAGIGGCPYAPGAKGNISTNDLVSFLEKKGIQTGVDQAKLEEATIFIRKVLGKE